MVDAALAPDGVDDRATDLRRRAWDVAAAVADPEIPVLTLADLGVLRRVDVADDGAVRVEITPTYSGCPAMDVIAQDIRAALADAGFTRVEVATVLAPAWTTDWMSDAGREKLRAYGIAPPAGGACGAGADAPPACPRCASPRTERISQFGATACQALWRCLDCREPFDHFKCH